MAVEGGWEAELAMVAGWDGGTVLAGTDGCCWDTAEAGG